MGNVDYAPARRDRVQIAQQAHATVVTMPVSAAAQLQQPAQHRLPFPPSDLNYFSAHSARSTSLRSGCCCACDIHRRGRLRGRCGAAPRGRAAGVGCPRLEIHNCACCWRGALQQRRSPPPASFGGAAAAAAAGGQSQCVSFPPSLLLNAGGEEAGDREIRMQSTYEQAVQYAGCKTSAPNRTRVKGGIVKRGPSNNSASGGSISDTAGGATASSTRITCAATQTPAAEDAHALFYQP